jgi:hypothetical protein
LQLGTQLWLFYTDANNASVRTCRMADNYTELHATPQSTTIITGDREAPLPIYRNGVFFLITSSSNYYDGASSFNISYIISQGAHPATGWPAIANLAAYAAVKTDLFAVDPVGTPHNGQPTAAFMFGNQLVYMGDFFNATQLYDSKYVFSPLTFPTNTTVVAGVPTSWFPTGGGSAGGSYSGIISD